MRLNCSEPWPGARLLCLLFLLEIKVCRPYYPSVPSHLSLHRHHFMFLSISSSSPEYSWNIVARQLNPNNQSINPAPEAHNPVALWTDCLSPRPEFLALFCHLLRQACCGLILLTPRPARNCRKRSSDEKTRKRAITFTWPDRFVWIFDQR